MLFVYNFSGGAPAPPDTPARLRDASPRTPRFASSPREALPENPGGLPEGEPSSGEFPKISSHPLRNGQPFSMFGCCAGWNLQRVVRKVLGTISGHGTGRRTPTFGPVWALLGVN